MFGLAGAVSDEERLEGAETRAVLRRAAQMASPFRRTVLAALAFIAVSTAATVGGPLLVRYGIDTGIREGDAGALDLAVVLYIVVAIVAYLGRAPAARVRQPRRRGVPADPAHPRVRSHPDASRWPSSTATSRACSCRG